MVKFLILWVCLIPNLGYFNPLFVQIQFQCLIFSPIFLGLNDTDLRSFMIISDHWGCFCCHCSFKSVCCLVQTEYILLPISMQSVFCHVHAPTEPFQQVLYFGFIFFSTIISIWLFSLKFSFFSVLLFFCVFFFFFSFVPREFLSTCLSNSLMAGLIFLSDKTDFSSSSQCGVSWLPFSFKSWFSWFFMTFYYILNISDIMLQYNMLYYIMLNLLF